MLHKPKNNQLLHTLDGTTIIEVMGRRTTQDRGCSVAQITMPAGGGQPARQNSFREVLIVIDGECEVDLPAGTVRMEKGDVLDLPPGTEYAERGGPQGCRAWAICWPAFAPELVTWSEEHER
ncbi:MAG: hypothetical protein NVS4B8_06560 [Herpetosiphon sp.]